jgi:predicted S18 family serine protease
MDMDTYNNDIYYTDNGYTDYIKIMKSYKKGNLKGAILSWNEIMIDTKEVILIENNDYYYELIMNMMESY